MKVIEHGSFYKEDRTIRCICGCKYEYEIDDICKDALLSLTTCPEQHRRYVYCPECGARADIGTTYEISNTNKITPYSPFENFGEEV